MTIRFLMIYQNVLYFAPYWAPKGASPINWTNLHPHPPSIFPTKFGWNGQVVFEEKSTFDGKSWRRTYRRQMDGRYAMV